MKHVTKLYCNQHQIMPFVSYWEINNFIDDIRHILLPCFIKFLFTPQTVSHDLTDVSFSNVYLKKDFLENVT